MILEGHPSIEDVSVLRRHVSQSITTSSLSLFCLFVCLFLHTFLFGRRSVLQADQSSTQTSFFFSHTFVICVVHANLNFKVEIQLPKRLIVFLVFHCQLEEPGLAWCLEAFLRPGRWFLQARSQIKLCVDPVFKSCSHVVLLSAHHVRLVYKSTSSCTSSICW